MLYQILSKNLYCHENSEPEKTYQKFIEGCGKIKIYEDKVVVLLKKKRSTGYLINAPILEGWVNGDKSISWLGKKTEKLSGNKMLRKL